MYYSDNVEPLYSISFTDNLYFCLNNVQLTYNSLTIFTLLKSIVCVTRILLLYRLQSNSDKAAMRATICLYLCSNILHLNSSRSSTVTQGNLVCFDDKYLVIDEQIARFFLVIFAVNGYYLLSEIDYANIAQLLASSIISVCRVHFCAYDFDHGVGHYTNCPIHDHCIDSASDYRKSCYHYSVYDTDGLYS